MSGSPQPEYYAAEADMGRGFELYIFDRLDGWPTVRGGPFATPEEAESEIDRRYEEMSDLYDAVEERARRDGVTVCW